MSKILEAKSIYKSYEKDIYVLKDIHLTFEENSFTVILGHSGSGKTTLLNILSTILTPTSGEIFYKEKEIANQGKSAITQLRRNEIGFIFQNYLLLSNLTVRENILIGASKTKEALNIEELSSFLGIQALLDKLPYELSGGEQQRVAIARALIKKPTILFCDEATGALDETNSKNIVALLQKIKREYGMTIIFSTHNSKIAHAADRIIYLKDGKIHHDEQNEQILSSENINWEI